jgi:hypothetical protein
MRVAHLVIALFAITAAACGGKPGKSICDNQVPPPAACMTMCDPSPGAANTCPGGYHCAADGYCDALCTPSGNECGDGYVCTPDGRCKGENECEGLECDITACQKQNKPETTISGTVYAPNGTLPLYGIKVYVPNAPVPPMPDGAQCARCDDMNLPGSPVKGIVATSDEAGKFTLTGMPSGSNVPLVITSGKWRRQITIPSVGECADTALPATETRLPKNKSEGDLPKIAVSTGSADALECLLPKLGIDLAEITTDGGAGRIHLYADTGAGGGQGENQFQSGGMMFANSTALWSTSAKLKEYDIVILSCEGAQHPETKPQGSLDALKEYADVGGRVFLSHWHNIWIEGSTQGGGNQRPAVWPMVATWSNAGNTPDPVTDIIDEINNPKGSSFATWMLNVMGSMTRGQIVVNEGRTTVQAVDNARAERWVYYQQNANTQLPQNFQFTTPNEAAADMRCGKVVFSDMHVSAGSTSQPGSPGYPNQCDMGGLTPQEKALAFMFFDLASCVGVLL